MCDACATWEGAALAYCPRCPLSVHPTARLSKRLSAALIDLALLALPFFLAIWAGLFLAARSDPLGRHMQEIPLKEGTSLLWLLASLALPLFVEFGFQIALGRSLGKWAVGIRVVDVSGEQADVVQVVFLRNVAPTLLYGFCGVPAIVDLVMLLGVGNRRLKDRIAKTRVVDDAREVPA